MEKRFLIAATAGLLGGFCLSHLHTLDGRLAELEHDERVPEGELGHLQVLLARMELRLGGLQAELDERERELARWRELTTECVAQTVEARLSAADLGTNERWSLLESELSEAARLTREHEDRLQALAQAQPSDDSLWRDLMAPTVQLAGSGTVGTGVLLASEPVDGATWRTPVLTAWHVVRDILAEAPPDEQRVPVRIYEPDGQSRVESARLLRYDPGLDVALLELETTLRVDRGARLASRNRLASLRTFDPVFAVGCPLGNDPIPTRGALADTHHQVDGGRYWMVSAPTYIGNSGGGIFDARTHELVGIFSKIYTHGTLRPTVVPHMGLATPLQDVYDWLDSEGIAGLEPLEPEPIAKSVPATVPAGVVLEAEVGSSRSADPADGH
jgi:S1-C subfamily serine protease